MAAFIIDWRRAIALCQQAAYSAVPGFWPKVAHSRWANSSMLVQPARETAAKAAKINRFMLPPLSKPQKFGPVIDHAMHGMDFRRRQREVFPRIELVQTKFFGVPADQLLDIGRVVILVFA